jgi:hypothetical protein
MTRMTINGTKLSPVPSLQFRSFLLWALPPSCANLPNDGAVAEVMRFDRRRDGRYAEGLHIGGNGWTPAITRLSPEWEFQAHRASARAAGLVRRPLSSGLTRAGDWR